MMTVDLWKLGGLRENSVTNRIGEINVIILVRIFKNNPFYGHKHCSMIDNLVTK